MGNSCFRLITERQSVTKLLVRHWLPAPILVAMTRTESGRNVGSGATSRENFPYSLSVRAFMLNGATQAYGELGVTARAGADPRIVVLTAPADLDSALNR
jgi:hypothetical protein